MVHYTFKNEGGIFRADNDFIKGIIKIIKDKYEDAFVEIEEREEDEMCPSSEYLLLKITTPVENEEFFIIPLDTQELIFNYLQKILTK